MHYDIIRDPEAFATLDRIHETIELLKRLKEAGDGQAAYTLAAILISGTGTMPDHLVEEITVSHEKGITLVIEAFHLLLKEAEDGNVDSMRFLSFYYQCGMAPVTIDDEQFVWWNEKAWQAGSWAAAWDLYPFYLDPHSEFYNPEKARELKRIYHQRLRDKEADS